MPGSSIRSSSLRRTGSWFPATLSCRLGASIISHLPTLPLLNAA